MARELGEQTEQDILEKIRQCANDGFTRIEVTNAHLETMSEEEPPVLKATLVGYTEDEK